jgi:acyl-CoA hydrolase
LISVAHPSFRAELVEYAVRTHRLEARSAPT